MLILFLISLLFISIGNPIALAQSQTKTIVVLTGRISYLGDDVPPGFVLKYHSDFENVTKLDEHHLEMDIKNYFEFGTSSNASMWMEGLDRITNEVTPHSGSRCVGMEVVNGYRNEFNIGDMLKLVGNEFFISVWLYLPGDWAAHQSDNWYSLCDTFMADGTATPVAYYPYNEVYIHQTNVGSASPDFEISTNIRDNVGLGQYIIPIGLDIQHFQLPRGQWFNLKYYVNCDVSNGTLKIWIDNALICNSSNVKTQNANEPAFFSTIAKIYHDPSDTYSGYKLWVDDLEIYGVQ